MPTFDVTSPDGIKYRVTAPEGASHDEIIAYAQRNIGQESKPTATAVSGPLEAAAINAGAWVDRKAAGLREAVPAPIRGAIDKLGSTLGMAPPPASDTDYDKQLAPVRQQQPAASFIGGVAPDLMVTNPLSMGVLAAMDPGSAGERLFRGSLSAGVGKLGQELGGLISEKMGRGAVARTAERATDQAQNAQRDTLVQQAQDLGLKLPPTMVNPTAATRLMEGASGKTATGQALSIKNAKELPNIARRELGLPDSAPLTEDTFKQVRKVAGSAYDTLEKFGPIQVDDSFRSAVNNSVGKYQSLAQKFSSQRNGEIDDLIKDLNHPGFDSADVVELVKRLRYDGFKNIRAESPKTAALGHIQLQAQEALEDLVDRNLQAAGQGDFLNVFRNARKMIAKSYTIQNAVEEGTGKVVAGKLKGRGMSGDLATVAKLAQAYPKAFQNVNTSMPGVSPLDTAVAVLGAVNGSPWGLAAALGRPAVRSVLTSDAFQKSLKPNYGPTSGDALMEYLGKRPREMEKLGGLLGIGGLRASQ